MNAKQVELGGLVDIVMGQAPPGEACNKEERGTIFVKAGEFQERTPIIREWTTKPLKHAKTNDVLLCVVGATAGKVNQSTFDCAIGRSVAAVRARDDYLDPLFLFQFLQTKVGGLRGKSQGAAQGVITREMIQSLSLVLPTLSEQRRIAAILDQADALRVKRKEALAQLDSLTQAIFIDMFGDPVINPKKWQILALSKACVNITDGTHDTPKRVSKGIPFITSKNIRPFQLDLADLEYVTLETYQEIIKRCHPKFEDVLYTNIGANVGNAVMNQLTFEFSLKNVALIQPNKLYLNSTFLESLLNYETFKQNILGKSSTGGAQKFIPLKTLREINIVLPPIETQVSYASRVAEVRKISLKHTSALGGLNELFASLQSSAFRGEL